MSNNPNKLAWKGTPGPWMAQVETLKNGQKGGFLIIKEKIDLAYVDNFLLGRQQSEANAHLISAAPEAIEFIADWLYGIDGATLTHEAVENLYERAENILKKAYNF